MITDTRLRRVQHLEEALLRKASVELLGSLIEELLETGDRSGALLAFRKYSPAFSNAPAQTQRRLRALHERILWNAPGDTLATNLPHSRYVIVGRNTELYTVTEALRSERTVTLLGAGGVGKTRIAMEIGRRLIPEFSDGVWWIDLRGACDTTWVQRVAAAFDATAMQDEAALIEALAEMECLLVFDGCEHAAASLAPALDRIASSCPRVRVLATSRSPVNVKRERLIRIDPLPVPAPDEPAAAMVRSSSAVQLFVERAAGADPRFMLTESNASAIRELCRRLDGLPLAIELAAAASSYVPLDEISSHIEAFSGGLQQTMAWSVELLGAAERGVLTRLAVFAAPFGFEEARAAGGVETEASLKRLIDASLLHMRVENGVSEYYLLDVMREFVDGLLSAAERAAAQRGVLALYAKDAVRPDFANLEEVVRERLSDEGDVLACLQALAHCAIRFGMTGSVEAIADLCESAVVRTTPALTPAAPYIETLRALAWLDNRRGLFRHAMARNSEAAQLAQSAGEAGSEVRALSGLYISAINAGDYDAAERAASHALSISEALRDPELLAVALRCRAGVHVALAQFTEAIPYFERLLTLDLDRVPQTLLAMGLHDYALAHLHLGHFNVARTLARRSIEVCASIGDYSTQADAYNALGAIELAEGRLEPAFEAYRESLALSARPGTHPITRARTLEGCAASSMRDDQLEAIAQVLGCAEQQRVRFRAPRNPFERGKADALHAALASRMGAARLEAALLAGRTRSYRDASRLAEGLQCGSAPPERAERFACLTPREREIAELAAAGASNREVSEKLHLSVRTVENHLAAIYKKLGIRTRAELVAGT